MVATGMGRGFGEPVQAAQVLGLCELRRRLLARLGAFMYISLSRPPAVMPASLTMQTYARTQVRQTLRRTATPAAQCCGHSHTEVVQVPAPPLPSWSASMG